MTSTYYTLTFKAMFLFALTGICITNNAWCTILLNVFTDVFMDVGVLVFLTLYLLYYLDHYCMINLKNLSQYSDIKQIFFCTFLGGLPGCGGAIFVVNQFLQGKINFSALTAAFVSTMGDAVFVLLSNKPAVGVFVIIVSLISGVATGCIILLIHGPDFMKRDLSAKTIFPKDVSCASCIYKYKTNSGDDNFNKNLITFYISKVLEYIWFILCVIAFGLIVMHWFGLSILTNDYWYRVIGVLGIIISLLIWLIRDIPLGSLPTESYCATHGILHDCIFIIFWVLSSVMCYEILVEFLQIDIDALFQANLYWLPLLGVIIGIIPGCGPQIVVVTMYINGLIPLSAQIGNAISTDGDALIPALVIDSRSTIFATLYSMIPAIIVSYACMLLFNL